MRRATVKQIEIASEIFPANAKIAAMVPISWNEANDYNRSRKEFMYVTKGRCSPWKQTVNIPLVVEERKSNEPSIHRKEFRDLRRRKMYNFKISLKRN